MPIWGTWLGGGATAPLANQTAASAADWVRVYNNQTSTTTGNNYFWLGADNTETATTTTSTTVWVTTNSATLAQQYQQLYWENELNQAQYVALSRQRVVMTAERQAAMERQRIEAQQRYDEAQRVREAARVRSRQLLLEHLTPQQRETFERNSWFVVEGGQSRQLYRIRDKGNLVANIDVLEGLPGKVTHRLCCHLRDHNIPLYDHLLAQKVWIERDEREFLRTANRHAA